MPLLHGAAVTLDVNLPPSPPTHGVPAAAREAEEIPVVPKLASGLPIVARAAGLAIMAVGFTVLLGRTLGVPAVARLGLPYPEMMPNTALGLLLCGVPLLAPQKSVTLIGRRLVGACVALVTLLGAATLFEHAVDVDLGLDRLLFPPPSHATRAHAPGRMALFTALSFSLLGPALAALRAPGDRWIRCAQGLALVAIGLSVIPLVGQLYGAIALYQGGPFSPTRIPTTAALLVTGLAVLAARPDRGPMRMFISDTAGAATVRWIAPLALAVPVALSRLVLAGQSGGCVSAELGNAVLALGSLFFLGILAWWNTRSVTASEEVRRKLERELTSREEQHRGASALARSEAGFRVLVERAPVGVLVVRGDTIVYANPVVLRSLGYTSADQVLGRSAIEVMIHPEMREVAARRIANARAGSENQPVAMRCLGADGRELVMNTTSVHIPFEGEPAVVIVGRDVTAEVEAESARQRAEAELRESLAEKEMLLKEVHHRVNNNLQVIASLLHLQRHRLTDPDARAAFDDLRGRVHAIALLHERLYRSQSLARVDMQGYVAGLVEHLQRTHSTGHQIDVEVEAGGIFFEADTAVPVGLIVNELTTNAFKHAFAADGPGGHIGIHLCRKDGALELSVVDDGRGMTTPDTGERAGSLGMQLVAGLARQLRGELSITRDGGTRCAVRFPDPAYGAAAHA